MKTGTDRARWFGNLLGATCGCALLIVLASWCQAAVDKPDFAITGASGNIVPWAPAPDGTITGSITVANTGSVGGDAGHLTYWADWDWDWDIVTNQPDGDCGGGSRLAEPWRITDL